MNSISHLALGMIQFWCGFESVPQRFHRGSPFIDDIWRLQFRCKLKYHLNFLALTVNQFRLSRVGVWLPNRRRRQRRRRRRRRRLNRAVPLRIRCDSIAVPLREIMPSIYDRAGLLCWCDATDNLNWIRVIESNRLTWLEWNQLEVVAEGWTWLFFYFFIFLYI